MDVGETRVEKRPIRTVYICVNARVCACVHVRKWNVIVFTIRERCVASRSACMCVSFLVV